MPHADLYIPDGNATDGPRDTAQEQAVTLAMIRLDPPQSDAEARTDRLLWSDYRNAAAYEGERYSEAIRGAASMRERAAVRRYGPDDDGYANFVLGAVFTEERQAGIPLEWITR